MTTDRWKTIKQDILAMNSHKIFAQPNPAMRSVPMEGLHDGNTTMIEELESNIATSIH